MKFKFIFIIIFLSNCTINTTKLENRAPFNSKGFALIFKDVDYDNKIVKGKLDNSKLQIAHRTLKPNTLVKIINLQTNDSIILKNYKTLDYPDFYKILITPNVATKLNIKNDLPLVEILEIKKNKSFVAEKAKIFKEEKTISSNAPVESVHISNISKNKNFKKDNSNDNFFILIGSFYSKDTAVFLKQRINKEIPDFNINKLKILKKRTKEVDVISGPYNNINIMKNDYTLLKKFGFEELNIIYE